jgi:hypothetical protein
MSTQHDEVSLLGSALVEQFLCRIAERHTCLYTDLALQLGWNQVDSSDSIWWIVRSARTSARS